MAKVSLAFFLVLLLHVLCNKVFFVWWFASCTAELAFLLLCDVYARE